MKGSYARDTRKILVQAEDTRMVFQSDRGDQSINGFQADAFRPSPPRNRGCLAVSRETARLEQFPHGKKVFHAMDIPLETLQDLRHDDAG